MSGWTFFTLTSNIVKHVIYVQRLTRIPIFYAQIQPPCVPSNSILHIRVCQVSYKSRQLAVTVLASSLRKTERQVRRVTHRSVNKQIHLHNRPSNYTHWNAVRPRRSHVFCLYIMVINNDAGKNATVFVCVKQMWVGLVKRWRLSNVSYSLLCFDDTEVFQQMT